MGRQVIRNKVCTKIYKSEKKLRKGIEKMARHGWTTTKITAFDKRRGLIGTHFSLKTFGATGAFNRSGSKFIVIYERS